MWSNAEGWWLQVYEAAAASISFPGSNRLFQVLDLYWRSPESGGFWYSSGQLKKTICSHSEGWWLQVYEAAAASISFPELVRELLQGDRKSMVLNPKPHTLNPKP